MTENLIPPNLTSYSNRCWFSYLWPWSIANTNCDTKAWVPRSNQAFYHNLLPPDFAFYRTYDECQSRHGGYFGCRRAFGESILSSPRYLLDHRFLYIEVWQSNLRDPWCTSFTLRLWTIFGSHCYWMSLPQAQYRTYHCFKQRSSFDLTFKYLKKCMRVTTWYLGPQVFWREIVHRPACRVTRVWHVPRSWWHFSPQTIHWRLQT